MILDMGMTLEQKLAVLGDAAKYDVACTSSGVERAGKKDKLGNTVASGICHSFSADGRCISLLKVLYTNECIFDCKYCINRASNDVPRASFTPEELCELTIAFYRRNYIEGLFLSSGILHSPDETMGQILEALRLLRTKYHFDGYIHCKAIPGAHPDLVELCGWYADRMSVNLELPTAEGLRQLAPHKSRKTILTPMRQIQDGIGESQSQLGLTGGNKGAYWHTQQNMASLADGKRGRGGRDWTISTSAQRVLDQAGRANAAKHAAALELDSGVPMDSGEQGSGSFSTGQNSGSAGVGRSGGTAGTGQNSGSAGVGQNSGSAGVGQGGGAVGTGQNSGSAGVRRSGGTVGTRQGGAYAAHEDGRYDLPRSANAQAEGQLATHKLTFLNEFRAARGFVPAGQSTQMIIGATPENDYQLISVAEALYQRFDLKRVFYSAFIRVNDDNTLPVLTGGPPLLREHRLYQADWLLRYYGFQAQEILTEQQPNFNVFLDPKCNWALRNLERFPVEVQTADYYTLLRVPGIGMKSAKRIVNARRFAKLGFDDLKKMGVVLKRALYFITCSGKLMYPVQIEENFITRQLVGLERNLPGFLTGTDVTYQQLSLFDTEQFGGRGLVDATGILAG